MAHSRSRSRQGSQRSTRRETAWEQGPGAGTLVSISSSSKTILGTAFEPAVPGLTIVRIRGNLQAYLKTASAGDSGFHCAVGIGIVTTDAFSIGVTAMPGPLSDIFWDGWLFHQIFDIFAASGTIADNFNLGLAVERFEIDSKAMRKFRTNMTVFAMLETVEGGTATMSVRVGSRMLLKLP